MPATDTSLRFKSQLIIEVAFNESVLDSKGNRVEEIVKIATLFDQQVSIASCCCTLISLTLPNYNDPSPATRTRGGLEAW